MPTGVGGIFGGAGGAALLHAAPNATSATRTAVFVVEGILQENETQGTNERMGLEMSQAPQGGGGGAVARQDDAPRPAPVYNHGEPCHRSRS